MEIRCDKFYTEAAEKVSHPVGKKMFLSIAEDEKNHIKMIGEVLKGLELTYIEANPVKTVKTIFEEMKDNLMKRIQAQTDDLEAFKIAMEMEKKELSFIKKSLMKLILKKRKNFLKD